MDFAHRSYRICMIVFILSLQLRPSWSQGTPPIMCSTGTFTSGSRAFVQCLFNRNINGTVDKYNFNIVQFNRDDPYDSGNHIVLCSWRSRELECMVDSAAGYSFNSNSVSDRLTVEIAHVNQKHVGRFACQVIPNKNIPVQTCDLGVEVPPTTPPQPTAVTPAAQTITCDDGPRAAVIELAIVVAVCIGIIVALLFYLYRLGKLKDLTIRGVLDCKWLRCCPAKAAATTDGESGPEEIEGKSLLTKVRGPAAGSSKHLCTVETLYEPSFDRDFEVQVEQVKKENRNVKDWSEADVNDWLVEVASENYKPLFELHMDGNALLNLNPEEKLKGLGFSDKNVEFLAKRIKELQQQKEAKRAERKRREKEIKKQKEDEDKRLQKEKEEKSKSRRKTSLM